MIAVELVDEPLDRAIEPREGVRPIILLPIFTGAIGSDDAEHMRQTLFDPGNLAQPYHSINTDVQKRIRYLT